MNHADIDIDLKNRNDLLQHVSFVSASIDRNGEWEKHNSGVYFQPIPRDPFYNMSTIDHGEAGELGYFKIDLLNNSVYQDVQDEQHLNRLLEREPNWELLEDPQTVSGLFHLNQHVELTTTMKPKNIDQLAMLLALIRPGKAYLRYKPWHIVSKDVWQKNTEGYFFKKSHSYAFALAIVVQLNSLSEKSDG